MRMITTDDILKVVIPVIYGKRVLMSLLLAVGTAFLTWQALQIKPDAGFDKSIPLEHPYMKVLKQYQADFGGANTVLIALIQKDGEIYNEEFLTTLKKATDEVFFLPGVDRSRVSSIFTPDVRYIEVVEGGFRGGNVIPANYAPEPEMFELVKANVGKAGIIGRLVTKNQDGAMITSELLEVDPVSGKKLDYQKVAHDLEDKIRGRFTSPTLYTLKLTEDVGKFKKGEVIAETFSEPDWKINIKTFVAQKPGDDGVTITEEISGRKLEYSASENPDYNPNIDVHVIGFAKVVGDVTDATLEVILFFGIAIVMTMVALWWYVGSLKLALLPMACSVVAVLWEFGLLHMFGFGLDPFAILVPFLVLAVSTSHGVQYVNTWADEVMEGKSSYDASVETFRRLAIPGTIALLTDLSGFLTIQFVPIDIIRELSWNAAFGMLAIIITNKVMMPIWLSYVTVKNFDEFAEKRTAKLAAGDKLWNVMSLVTVKPVAFTLIMCSAAVLAWSIWMGEKRIIGDAQTGVPELRPNSIYNQDSRAITKNFEIGVDILKIIAETDPEACIFYEVMEQIDRFAWHMDNTAGVQSTISLPQVAKTVNAAFSEANPAFHVLPRNRYVMVQAITPVPTSSGLLNPNCSAMAVLIFTSDHKAPTIDHIIDTVKDFNTTNAEAFYEIHKEVDAEYCAAKTDARRAIGAEEARMRRSVEKLKSGGDMTDSEIEASDIVQAHRGEIDRLTGEFKSYNKMCPVNFAIASANVGVMAATNEVVHEKEFDTVIWVYVVITIFLILSYRSFGAVLAIVYPLAAVSVLANALMALFDIGLKVATLPVVALAVGIGVDYGIYIYDVIQEEVERGKNLRDAYFETLRQTGKAVIFTGICLSGGVATWLFSDLQFQRDMGTLLVFMFSANMLGAVILCPALCRFVIKLPNG